MSSSRLKDWNRPTSADTALERLNFIIAIDRARNREDRRAGYVGPPKLSGAPAYHRGGVVDPAKIKHCSTLEEFWPNVPRESQKSPSRSGQALGTRTFTINVSDAPALGDTPTARAIERMIRKPPRVTQTNPTPILLMLLEQELRQVQSRIQRERSKRHPVFSPGHVLLYDLGIVAAELERSASELANRSPDDYGRVGDSDPALQLNLTGEQYALLSTTLKQRLDTLQPHNYMGKPQTPESP